MAYHISYIGLLLALSVVCCNAAEQQHLRGRGNQKTERTLHDIFLTAYRIVSPQQSHHKRIQTIPAVNNNSDLKSTYIQQCQSYLLDDPSITNDGIISQVDFANMLLNQCQQLDMCPHKKLKFEQLDINLQLKFINGICYHQDRVDKFNCIKNLNVMWLEGELFGFELDGDEDVDTLVYDMCTDTYTDAVKMGFARTNGKKLMCLFSALLLDIRSTNINCIIDSIHACSTNPFPQYCIAYYEAFTDTFKWSFKTACVSNNLSF